ncbi:MAG: trypsin-like serine protease [Candidatus Limnocylindria bacterium]
MRRAVLALIAAALMAISAVMPAAAITGNSQEDFEHPFVGLVAFYDIVGVEDDPTNQGDDPLDTFLGRCSGSLIDDGNTANGSRVFLTAGHCPDVGDGVNVADYAFIWFRQDAGTRFDGVANPFDPLTGYPDRCIDDPAVALDACVKAHVMFNYGFNNFAGFPDTHDTGIVILDSAVSMPEYGELPDVGALDVLVGTGRGSKDTTFLASGYGLSYSSPVAFESFRERLMGFGKLVNLVSANNGGFNIQTNGNGHGKGGTCSGDSGGPIFWPADTNQIVAVTSFGLNAWCRGTDFSYRLDTAAVQDWIAEVSAPYAD